MTHFVVDASVAVEYLLRTPLGLTVADMIEGASLTAPELMDAEVVSVLRRGVLSGRLEEARARMVITDLTHWPVDRISHRSLAALAWQHHRNVSAYEAFYVAAARVVSQKRIRHPLKDPGWTPPQARGGLKKNCRYRTGPV